MCPSVLEFLANAPATRIREYLVDEVETPEEGRAAMRHLENRRPAVFNETLCLVYDVACYQNRESCFANHVAAEDLDRWFVSTTVASDLPDVGELPLSDSEAQAHALAVSRLGLRDIFFCVDMAL